MVKTRIWVGAPLAFALVLAMSSVQCTADQSEAPTEATTAKVRTDGFQPGPDDLRVTVVATGLGEPVRSTHRREQPVRLVANGTIGRAASAPIEDVASELSHEQQQPIRETGSKDLFERQKDIDYLDIPSFLRTQAD